MAQTISVRISKDTKRMLDEISAETGESIVSLIDGSVKEHYKRMFWKQVSDDFAQLRHDPEKSNEYDEEIKLLEGTLADGLD